MTTHDWKISASTSIISLDLSQPSYRLRPTTYDPFGFRRVYRCIQISNTYNSPLINVHSTLVTCLASMDREDPGLCEGCSQIDLKRHIYGDNGLRYRIRNVDIGPIRTLRERSRRCALCRAAVQSFGSSAAEDLQCHLYATAFCTCPLRLSDEHDEALVCQHPKHIVFKLDSRPPRYAGFQISFDSRATLLWEASDTNAVEFVETTDETCFTGRAVAEQVDLGLVRRWMDLCEYHHGTECHDPIWPGSPPQPKHFLVVDVEQRCIVSAPPNCRFMALSYVWGSAQQKKLTRKNWDVLSQAGALDRSDLPATICDAILLTRALGEKYCWVDALCIFQDDPASQQDQISQMGAIYSRALITIVNAAGDGSAGLPGVHAGTRNLQQIKIQLQGFNLIKVVDEEDIYTDSRHNISMWEKRAWTYQERLFSKRMIIFRKQQIYWHCRSATWVEEKILETRGIPTTLASVQRMVHRPDIPRTLSEHSSQSFETIADKEYLLYSAFVQAYTVRQLSYGSDALNAFAGICRALSLLSKDEFIWGLPKSSFTDALAWRADTSQLQKNTCLQNVLLQDGLVHQLPFPSWSWASQFRGTLTKFDTRAIRCSAKGTILEPDLIVFFSCIIDGGMTRIIQCPDYSNEPSQNSPPRNSITAKWLGYPRVIPNVLKPTPDQEIVHSGTLKFWTSVATIYFFRERQRRPLSTFLSPNGDVLIATAHLDLEAYVSPDDPRIPKEVRLAELKNPQGDNLQSDCNLTILDLVIVHGEFCEVTGGISGLSRTGRVLHALSVGWKNGVAFREGHVVIAEEHWILLKNREWKLVTVR